MCPVEERSAVVKESEDGFVCSECDTHLGDTMGEANESLEEHTE